MTRVALSFAGLLSAIRVSCGKSTKEWYEAIAALLPLDKDPVLELGSGGGFLS